MSKPDKIEAVAVMLAMDLPPEVVAKYRVSKWTAAKYGGERVDEGGQRWGRIEVPLGEKVHRTRGDLVVAVALVKGPDGYTAARLEIPMSVASEYAIESTLPDPHRPSVLERAAGMLDEAVT